MHNNLKIMIMLLFLVEVCLFLFKIKSGISKNDLLDLLIAFVFLGFITFNQKINLFLGICVVLLILLSLLRIFN